MKEKKHDEIYCGKKEHQKEAEVRLAFRGYVIG
jgi:hypothetical protein